MSCYYAPKRDMLVLKCDSCGKQVDLYKGQTDRLLKHEYIRENGWKTMKSGGKWIDLCDECKTHLEAKNRETYLSKLVGE